MRLRLLSLLSTVALAACAANEGTPKSGTPDVEVAVETRESDLPRETNPSVPEGDQARLVRDNAEFGLQLQRAVVQPDENAVLSPFSISEAMAMAWAGARAGTESEIATALHFGLPQQRLHAAFNGLSLALGQREGLRIVNSLWGQSDYPFLEPFLDTLKCNYGAGMRLLDFRTEWETGRKVINDWVAQETKQRIQELIPQGFMDKTTRLVLVNAITFDRPWAQPFESGATIERAFRRADQTYAWVKTMHRSGVMRGLASTDYTAVELPYQGNAFSMVVVQPASLRDFEASLTAERLSQIVRSLTEEDSNLALPRFKIASASIDLSKALQEMGMKRSFNPDTADFGAMADLDKTNGENLFIQAVLHKAFIAVGEEGTEAAAATAVVMGGDAGCAVVTPPRRRALTFDRPFLFFIRDVASGTILFLGHVTDPRE